MYSIHEYFIKITFTFCNTNRANIKLINFYFIWLKPSSNLCLCIKLINPNHSFSIDRHNIYLSIFNIKKSYSKCITLHQIQHPNKYLYIKRTKSKSLIKYKQTQHASISLHLTQRKKKIHNRCIITNHRTRRQIPPSLATPNTHPPTKKSTFINIQLKLNDG